MAAKPNVDEASNGEEKTAPIEEAHLITNGEENTTQIQLVSPSSYEPDKTAHLDDSRTQAAAPESAGNSESEPCDRAGAETQRPKPKPDECNTSTLRCGQKRERESEDPSHVPVKHRSRPSEESREENLPDYDVRCAELWIDGEMAACEAYELSKPSSNSQRQNTARQQANRPLTHNEVLRSIRTEMVACYLPISKMIRMSMDRSRAEFHELVSRLNAIHRDTRELCHEISIMQEDEKHLRDAISLMNEKLSVIERFALDLHQVFATKK